MGSEPKTTLTADDVAARVNGECRGCRTVAISGVASLQEAEPHHLSFLGNAKYHPLVAQCAAAIILVPRDHPGRPADGQAWIHCDNPSAAFAAMTSALIPPSVVPESGRHPTAVVAESAIVPDSTHVGACAVIEAGVVLGERCIVEAGVYVGRDCQLGDDCRLYPNVTLYERTVIGQRVVIHGGTTVGAHGFGYIADKGGNHQKIDQLGIVQIDDDVEIGANATIDRARFSRTWIKRGAKIDNLVQIAHNVVVGERAILVALTGIAGSVQLGNDVILAGQVGVPPHTTVADRTTMMARTVPIANVTEPGTVIGGNPAVLRREYLRQQVAVRKLPDLAKTVHRLEMEVAALKARLGEE